MNVLSEERSKKRCQENSRKVEGGKDKVGGDSGGGGDNHLEPLITLLDSL